MAIKLFLRSKTGATSSIYFRYTKGRDLKVILKTPYSINPEHWDEEKESYKVELTKRTPKTVIEKNFNSEIAVLNNNLAILKSELSVFFANNPDATADEIKIFTIKNISPKRKNPKIFRKI